MARSPVSGVAATAGKLHKNARLAPRTLKRPRVVGIGYWNPGGLMSVAKQFARYCCDCSSHHEQIMDTRLCVIAAARLNGVMSRTNGIDMMTAIDEACCGLAFFSEMGRMLDRKSTRMNSSH